MPKYLINLFSSGLTFSTTGRLYATGNWAGNNRTLFGPPKIASCLFPSSPFFFYPFLPGSLLLPTYVFGLFASPPPTFSLHLTYLASTEVPRVPSKYNSKEQPPTRNIPLLQLLWLSHRLFFLFFFASFLHTSSFPLP